MTGVIQWKMSMTKENGVMLSGTADTGDTWEATFTSSKDAAEYASCVSKGNIPPTNGERTVIS